MQSPKLILPRKGPNVLRFADIYELSPGFNATEYRDAGYPFIVAKCSEGPSHIDKKHAEHCARAHAVNLPVGHYHFCRPEAGDVRGEAVTIADAIHGQLRAGEPVILDIEVGLRKGIGIYVRELERRTKQYAKIPLEIIGYMSLSPLRELEGVDVQSHKWWIADYTKNWRLRPPAKLGTRICWAWQYGDSERLTGVYGTCDASRLMNPASINYWRNHAVATK